jgi:hypothetical protein
MQDFPDTSPLVRTDFSDDAAWRSLTEAATASSPDGFAAEIRLVESRSFEGCSPEQLIGDEHDWQGTSVLFLADADAQFHPERPILCVDLIQDPGRTFRCVPEQLWGVENNLRLSNMDFGEFADSVDADGIFRDFR